MKAPPVYTCLPPETADRLRRLTLRVRVPVEGPRQGLHRSPHFGSSVEFAEYREYTPGDPPNLIDWAVLARSDRYVVRRFQEETSLRAWIALDVSGSLAFREHGRASKLDYARQLAAALLFVLVNQGDSAGLLLFDSAIRARLEPAASLESLRPLLLALDAVSPAGRSDIESALHALAGRLTSRSLVIVISDLLEDPAAITRGLRHLHHDRHDVIVLHVMDGGETALSLEGPAELRELETGARLIVEADDLRAAYAREVAGYLDALRRGAAACMALYRFVDTRVPVPDQLIALARP